MLWLTLLLLVALCLFADYCWKRDVNAKWSQVPGPLSLPIIGCIWIYTQVQPDGLLSCCIVVVLLFSSVIFFFMCF